MIATLAPSTPNEVAEKLTGRGYVSFSAINTYASCPLRYRFRYVDGLPERTISLSLAFGSGVHAAIEFHFTELLAGCRPPDHDTLLDVFWTNWRERGTECEIAFNKAEDENSVGHLADRVLSAFRESDLAEPGGRIVGIEEQVRASIVDGVPELLARIDLVVEADDALVVTDFKTARSRWRVGQADDRAEQLLLYGELCRDVVPSKPIRLEFAVLTKTKVPVAERHPVTFDSARVERTKAGLAAIWRAIEGGHFYPAPSPMNCPSCPFRGPCREWTGSTLHQDGDPTRWKDRPS